jgi:hypothetical protein
MIEPTGNCVVYFNLDTSEMKGFQRRSFQLEVDDYENKLELFITTEVK